MSGESPSSRFGCSDVDVVVGVEGEDEHVREQLADPEHERGEADAPVTLRRPWPAGSTISVQTSAPDDDEREVLEPVDQGMPERRVVEGGEMPCDEHAEPQVERDARPEEEGEAAAQRLPARQRREQVAREGRTSRAGRGRATSASATPRSAISTCWSMCADWRYSSAIASSGETSASDDERDAREEQRPARPRRQLGPPPAQAPPALREEADRDDRAPSTSGSNDHAFQRSSVAVATSGVTAPYGSPARGRAERGRSPQADEDVGELSGP